MNLMCITCFLDERSAKLKCEGMDRMQVALAGSPPNCFLSLMGDFFGYQDSVPTPSDLAAPPSEPAPATTLSAAIHPQDPAAYQTLPDIGSRPNYVHPAKGPQPTLPTLYQANDKGVKPGINQKRWSRTRLSAEFQPVSVEGEDLYKRPFPECNFTPCQNIDMVACHIRRHLNLSISCHYCNKLFWGSEGWLRHCKNVHPSLPQVPAGYNTTEETPKDQDILGQAIEAYKIASAEEAKAVKEMANLLDTGKYDVETDFIAMDTELSDCQVVEDDKQGN